MDKANIMANEAAIKLLKDVKDALEAIGVHTLLAPMSLPQGMTISLHVGQTAQAAIAANVASTTGGLAAHTVNTDVQFMQEVAYALANYALMSAAYKPRTTKNIVSESIQNQEAMFLHQERVDRAVKTSLALDIDDLEFLKTYGDSLAISVEVIFSNGGWWLPNTDGTSHHVEAVLNKRKSR